MDESKAIALILNEVEYTIDEGRPTLGQTEEIEEALVKVEGVRLALKTPQDAADNASGENTTSFVSKTRNM